MHEKFELTLVLTHACDLACAYCSAGPKDARRLDEALGRRAIERAVACLAPRGTLELGFFGGEPLLEWPLARRLLAFARERAPRVACALTTNGTRVDERVARELVAEGIEVSLSIDGLPEVHDLERKTAGGRGSWAAARAAFERLAALGARPDVISVVRPGNVDRLVDGARFLVAGGARSLNPSLDFHARWTAPDVARLEAAVLGLGALWQEHAGDVSISWIDTKVALLTGLLGEKKICGFGRGEVAVAPSGRLYPCERLVQDDRSSRFVIGHVDDGDGPFTPNPGSSVPSSCGGCAALAHCANACACANVARTGFPDRPDGLVCALEQASFIAARSALEALVAKEAA
jgi:uncharacterized protein